MIHPTSYSFSEYYKTITDSELLLILENTDDYQEDAVEARRKNWREGSFHRQNWKVLKTIWLKRGF